MLQSPELFVEDGLQAGYSAPLALGNSLVGTDLDSAIVIADPELRPSHFEVIVKDGRTALRAVGGELLLPDGTALAPGQDITCTQEMSFQAGGTRFALRLPVHVDTDAYDRHARHHDFAEEAASATVPVAKSKASMVSGLMLVAAAGILMFTAVGLRSGRATPTSALASAVHGGEYPARHAMSASGIARELRVKLNAAGLAAVAVAPSGDGSVIVEGSLFPEQMAAWAPIRQWFDNEYGTNLVLVDEVMPASSGPQLTIAAVWAGGNPYVIDDRGSKMFVGAAVGGGWSIADIKPGHVTVQNGQQKVALSY